MKKILTLCLCLVLLLTLAPFAHAEGGHSCSGLDFDTPLSGELGGELPSGTYYLDGDAYLTRHVFIRGEVSLCLNGHGCAAEGATTFHVLDGGTLSIYDCAGTGVIGYYNTQFHNHPLTVDKGGTANVYGGWLYGKSWSNAINSQGTVNFYGGKAEAGDLGHCAARNEGSFNLYGGELAGTFGISQRAGAELHIRGNDFVIDAGTVALQYISDAAPLVIDTPYYTWRTDPDGEWTSSLETPYTWSKYDSYLAFSPLLGTIGYVLDGGNLPEASPSTYVCGEGTALPETVEKEGFVFTGWVDESGAALDAIPADATGDVVVTALYEPLATPQPEPSADMQEAQTELLEDDTPATSPLWLLFLLPLALFLVLLQLLRRLFRKR